MRILISSLVLFSLSAVAKPLCPSHIEEAGLYNMFEPSYSEKPRSEYLFESDGQGGLDEFSKEDFLNLPYIGQEFDYESCKGALRSIDFYDIVSGDHYHGIFTHDDDCDGGNSHGVLYNDKDEHIGYIYDGDFSCQE